MPLRLAPGAGDAGLRASEAPPCRGPGTSPRSWCSSASRPRRCGREWEAAARGVHPGAHLHPPAAARGRRAQLQHAAAAARRVRQGHDPGHQEQVPRPVHDCPARPGGGGQPARRPWPAARATRPARRSSCCARCWRLRADARGVPQRLDQVAVIFGAASPPHPRPSPSRSAAERGRRQRRRQPIRPAAAAACPKAAAAAVARQGRARPNDAWDRDARHRR